MSLQKRLSYLLAAFALFAVAAAFAVVYSVQVHLGRATARLQRALDEVAWAERLGLQAREQHVGLRELVAGTRTSDELDRAERDGFFDELDQFAGHIESAEAGSRPDDIRALTGQLRQAFDRSQAELEQGDPQRARRTLAALAEDGLLPALRVRLRQARDHVAAARTRAVDELVASDTNALVVSLLVGVFGAGLVAVGSALSRRWLVLPLRRLHQATQEFAAGNLAFGAAAAGRDELGLLAAALNRMAESLSRAHSELRMSEAKHRALFENLREALIICDTHARVIECHDSDTQLLPPLPPDWARRPLEEVWPHGRPDRLDWRSLIDSALREDRRIHIADLRLTQSGRAESAVVDLTAYPVEYGDARYVALSMRDVTRRWMLERQARRTEAMEAMVLLARGVAHDFGNLLTSAVSSLSALEAGGADGHVSERVRSALHACRQAAKLARRLLSFAGGDRGHPEVLGLRETLNLILESFDEAFFSGVRLRLRGSERIRVRIDRDHLTQIMLNLIINAREAMPDGGELDISVQTGEPTVAAPAVDAPPYAVIRVRDSGCGIRPEVRERLFEPFFSTKGRGPGGSRGMGLAIVYAAVKSAGGTVEVESEPGRGACFRVYLPLAEAEPEALIRTADRESREPRTAAGQGSLPEST